MGIFRRLESRLAQAADDLSTGVNDLARRAVQEIETGTATSSSSYSASTPPAAPASPPPAATASFLSGLHPLAFVKKEASSAASYVEAKASIYANKAAAAVDPYVPTLAKKAVDAIGYSDRDVSLLARYMNPRLIPRLDHMQQRATHNDSLKKIALITDALLLPNALNRVPLNAVAETSPGQHPNEPGLSPVTTGNEIIALVDGDAYRTELLKQIDAATTSIHLQVFEWDDDTSGNLIADALIAKHKKDPKVDIKLITDNRTNFAQVRVLNPQSRPDSPVMQKLVDAGLNIRQVDMAALRIDHRKISIFDGGTSKEVAFIGGQNLGDQYLTVGPKAYHDNTKRMRGPVVYDIAALFQQSWYETGGHRSEVVPPPRSAALSGVQGAGASVQIITHKGGVDRNIERELVQRINAETEHIVLANGFGMADEVFNAVIAARKRGVPVTWIWGWVDDDTTLTAQKHFAALKAAGVQLKRNGPMHMKEYYFASQDAELCGSANLDGFSGTVNDEGDAQIWGGGVGTDYYNRVLRKDIERDPDMLSQPEPDVPSSALHQLFIHTGERLVNGDAAE